MHEVPSPLHSEISSFPLNKAARVHMLQYPENSGEFLAIAGVTKKERTSRDATTRLRSALSRGKLNLSSTNILQWSHHYLTDSTGFQNYSLLNRSVQ